MNDDSGLPFTAEQWRTLPLALRQRWWAETDYGQKKPPPDLLRALRAALNPELPESSA